MHQRVHYDLISAVRIKINGHDSFLLPRHRATVVLASPAVEPRWSTMWRRSQCPKLEPSRFYGEKSKGNKIEGFSPRFRAMEGSVHDDRRIHGIEELHWEITGDLVDPVPEVPSNTFLSLSSSTRISEQSEDRSRQVIPPLLIRFARALDSAR
jgi:hypothetical protein